MRRSIAGLAVLLPIAACAPGAGSPPPPATGAATPAAATASAAPATEGAAVSAASPAASVPGGEAATTTSAPNTSTGRGAEPARPAPAPASAPAKPAANNSSPASPPAADSRSATAASAPATASAPAAPVRVRMDIPAGTDLPIELQTMASTASSREGDPVVAVLTQDIPLNGFTLRKGDEVRGRVATVLKAARVKGRARLVVAFDSVMHQGERLTVATTPIDSMAESTASKDKKIIAGGAVGGLIIGAIKDGKKGAAVGAVAGAAAGAGAVMIMKGDEVELPRGAHLIVTVTK